MKTRESFDIEEIAEFTISNFMNNDFPITPSKLQKILYYIQAWHLVLFDEKMIFEELPEAWIQGPVYRSIHEKYPTIESRKVTKEDLKKKRDELMLSDDLQEFLNEIYNKYGTMTDFALEYSTKKEFPWNEARNGCGLFDVSDRKISKESMFDYYNSI